MTLAHRIQSGSCEVSPELFHGSRCLHPCCRCRADGRAQSRRHSMYCRRLLLPYSRFSSRCDLLPFSAILFLIYISPVFGFLCIYFLSDVFLYDNPGAALLGFAADFFQHCLALASQHEDGALFYPGVRFEALYVIDRNDPSADGFGCFAP